MSMKNDELHVFHPNLQIPSHPDIHGSANDPKVQNFSKLPSLGSLRIPSFYGQGSSLRTALHEDALMSAWRAGDEGRPLRTPFHADIRFTLNPKP